MVIGIWSAQKMARYRTTMLFVRISSTVPMSSSWSLPSELHYAVAKILGRTELHSLYLTCRKYNAIFAKVLSDLNVKLERSYAIHWAILHHRFDIVKRFMNFRSIAGNAIYNYRTPLTLAVENRYERAIELLLSLKQFRSIDAISWVEVFCI